MWEKVVIFSLCVTSAYGERAGVTHCDPDPKQFPASPPASADTPIPAATSKSYLMESEDYMFTCCGVVSGWLIQSTTAEADITFQIWRKYSANNYTVISSWNATALINDNNTILETERMSFQEGDFIGWYTTTADLVGYVVNATAVAVNRHKTAGAATAIGESHDWSSEGAHFGRLYAISAFISPSTLPYFKNLPQRQEYADTEMVTAGVSILTIEANDLDPEDAGGLTVTMDPAWTDFFDLSDSLVVSTARSLGAGTYSPVFRVEEDHCGQTNTAVLTIVVTDSSPTITNLPAWANVHEDTLDQTLLYPVLLSDPTDQPVWCTDQWNIGPPPSKTPFVVKMISTAAGSSEAGVYLIEWPELAYLTTAVYELTIICQDTAQNPVSGTLFVNIIQNQAPVFINLPFVVEVDATSVVPGTVVYTISTSDADTDQITYDSICDPVGDCPFDLYGSGEVVLRERLLLWDTGEYTLTVTAISLRYTDVNAGAPQFDLVIRIINRNTAPALTNVGETLTVAENSAVSFSIRQITAADADAGDTLIYYMTIAQAEGYGLFAISSDGLLTTHATDVINYETLATTSYTLTIYVHDGKEGATGALTLNVMDVPEAPAFSQSAYTTTQKEGSNGTALPNAAFTIIDEDSGDSATLTLDCGTYDSYFSMDAISGIVSYDQDYDLDIGTLPTSHTCTVTVTDSANNTLTATTTLYIEIELDNDNSPIFSSIPYDVTVATDTVLGTSIYKVTVTDADSGTDGDVSLSLDQASLGRTFLFLDTDGTIYTSASLTSFADGATHILTVTATDGGTPSNVTTETVNIVFSEVVVITTTTTDRPYVFIEDNRTVYWLTSTCLAGLGCILIIVFLIYRYCRDRKEPLCKWKFNMDFFNYTPKQHPPKERSVGRRPKPLETERAPAIRQLRAPPFLPSRMNLYPKKGRVSDVTRELATPPGTSALLSGRVAAELGDEISRKGPRSPDPFSLIDEHPPPVPIIAPTHSFSLARREEMEYIRGPRSVGVTSELTYAGDVTPLHTPEPTQEPSDIDTEGLYTTKSVDKSNRVNVSPSPIWWDNTTTKHIAGTSMRLDEEDEEEKAKKPTKSGGATPVSPVAKPPTPGIPKSPVTKSETPLSMKDKSVSITSPSQIDKSPTTPPPIQTTGSKGPTPVQSPVIQTPPQSPIEAPISKAQTPIESPISKAPTPKPIQTPVSKAPTPTQSPVGQIPTPPPANSPTSKTPIHSPRQTPVSKVATPIQIPTVKAETPESIETPDMKTPTSVRTPTWKSLTSMSTKSPALTPTKIPTSKTPTVIPSQTPAVKTPSPTQVPVAKTTTPKSFQSPDSLPHTPIQTPETPEIPYPTRAAIAKTHTPTYAKTPTLKAETPIKSPVAKTPTPPLTPVEKSPTETPVSETKPISHGMRTSTRGSIPAATTNTPPPVEKTTDQQERTESADEGESITIKSAKSDYVSDEDATSNIVRVTPSPIWWDNTTTSYITGTAEDEQTQGTT